MENAVDALKIAFAVFVFVVALVVLFSYVSKAKATADYVLYYADETNFYNNLSSKGENRVVSTADVISTLYRYDEMLSITVNIDGGTSETFRPSNNKTDIDNYIKENLSKKENMEFSEEFVEVPISGIYDVGSDGSVVALSSVTKKVSITYTYPAKK